MFSLLVFNQTPKELRVVPYYHKILIVVRPFLGHLDIVCWYRERDEFFRPFLEQGLEDFLQTVVTRSCYCYCRPYTSILLCCEILRAERPQGIQTYTRVTIKHSVLHHCLIAFLSYTHDAIYMQLLVSR